MNLLDLLFPKKCLECKREGKHICDTCIGKVPFLGWLGSCYSVFKYQGVIRKAIISLKYKFAYDLVDELVALIVKRLKTNNLRFSNVTLVPIPLHRRRENWRGFNQAEIIGKKLANEMNWKFIPNLLIRSKETKPQVDLKGVDRRKNLEGAFVVNPTYKSKTSNTESVLLFDDVYTTGSTIKEAKKVLEDAGFKKVYSLTIAR